MKGVYSGENGKMMFLSNKDMSEFEYGYSLGTHYPGRKNIEVKRNKKSLEIRLSEHSAASVIILEKGGNP